ncbi:hypothetical protein BJF82_02880 [Kytococcus sp. CUA-901]|nr:hypothetical protein BJF82_02880 [Kytococcus sp. CUA-901]
MTSHQPATLAPTRRSENAAAPPAGGVQRVTFSASRAETSPTGVRASKVHPTATGPGAAEVTR